MYYNPYNVLVLKKQNGKDAYFSNTVNEMLKTSNLKQNVASTLEGVMF